MKTFFKKNKQVLSLLPLSISVLLLIIYYHIISLSAYLLIGVFSATIAGGTICAKIVHYLLNYNNPLTKKLCTVSKNFDCDQVLTSSAATVFKGFTWGDIGLMYFMSLFMFNVLSFVVGLTEQAPIILLLPGTVAFLCTFISIVYQWRVIGSWCKMCLLVIAVLWLQECLLVLYAKQNYALLMGLVSHFTVSFTRVTILFFVCICLSAVWLLIKPAIKLAGETEMSRKQLLIWKRNPALFNFLIKKAIAIDDASWENEYTLGKADAQFRIVVAISLTCPACKKAYSYLREWLQQPDADIQVTMRFKYHQVKPDPALLFVLDSYFSAKDEQQKQRVLNTWFDTMNLDKCKNALGNIPVQLNHTALLQRYESWFTDNHVQFTPAIIVKGHILPEQYRILDLKILLPKLPSVSRRRSA